MKTVVDSYAWIEHFIGSEKGRKVDEILQNSDEIYTPDMVLAEVARKYAREGVDERIIHTRLQQIEDASTIVGLDAELALEAAKCYLEMEADAKKRKLTLPGLFDAIILATGKSLDAKILTGDQHFRNLVETLWLG
ncbi:MAG TPA: PIN domain-containing protein [Candidatus Limnocylindrales bacterium]|nr:PIN domain-containing protein [Candidatus Limnocylindrales bacterium]